MDAHSQNEYEFNSSAKSAMGSAIPPPPPPLPKSDKRKTPVPPPPPLPPTPTPVINNSGILRAITAINAGHSDGDVSVPPRPPFHPCHMFFYGSLMNPEVLQAILGFPDTPTIRYGSIAGVSTKMWGIYPALVKNDGGRVSGTVWKVTSETEFLRLAAYETSAYTWRDCEVELSDGELLQNCRTFCWAGDADSKELQDGIFDLERYQKYFKPSVIRPRKAVDQGP